MPRLPGARSSADAGVCAGWFFLLRPGTVVSAGLFRFVFHLRHSLNSFVFPRSFPFFRLFVGMPLEFGWPRRGKRPHGRLSKSPFDSFFLVLRPHHFVLGSVAVWVRLFFIAGGRLRNRKSSGNPPCQLQSTHLCRLGTGIRAGSAMFSLQRWSTIATKRGCTKCLRLCNPPRPLPHFQGDKQPSHVLFLYVTSFYHSRTTAL